MVRLHIFGISDESTETTKSYSNFNNKLRWLWNSVYYGFCKLPLAALFGDAWVGNVYVSGVNISR